MYSIPGNRAEVERLISASNALTKIDDQLRNEKYELNQSDAGFEVLQNELFGDKNPLNKLLRAGNDGITKFMEDSKSSADAMQLAIQTLINDASINDPALAAKLQDIEDAINSSYSSGSPVDTRDIERLIAKLGVDTKTEVARLEQVFEKVLEFNVYKNQKLIVAEIVDSGETTIDGTKLAIENLLSDTERIIYFHF